MLSILIRDDFFSKLLQSKLSILYLKRLINKQMPGLAQILNTDSLF